MQQFTKQELDTAMSNYAPTVTLLIGCGLKYDLTERANKTMVLEHETVTDDPGRDTPIYQYEGIPLPKTYCDYVGEGNADTALTAVFIKIEKDVTHKIREVAYETDCLQNAYGYLQDHKQYGPYLVKGDKIIQLTPDTLRIVLVQHPTKVEHETGTRVEACIVVQLFMSVYKTYGAAKW